MTPRWLSAFLDLPAERFDAGAAFWAAVTGYGLSPRRGEHAEFATLVPPDGDDFLRVQRVGDGDPRVHLDVHVAEPRAAAAELVALGATLVADRGYVTMRSPHGMVFCLVTHPAATRPRPRAWPGGHTSLVDQVCLDIPPSAYDEECAFWQALTGSELRYHPPSELGNLVRPDGIPLRLLLQRCGPDREGRPVSAHLDLATTDRAAETARHVGLGAEAVRVGPQWTLLRDPTGAAYCVTDRDPETGLRG